jgi:nicotinamide mononucleotide transporter
MTTALEIIGMITGLWAVYLNFRENITGWPIGIISVALYAIVFFNTKLYADMGLQFFYAFMNGYGWYTWSSSIKKNKLVVIRISKKQWMGSISFTLCFGTLLSFLLYYYTDARLPVVDAFTCAISLAAQYLLAKKVLENWLLWIGVDIVYVGMYLRSDLYVTAILYFLFIVIAIWAYIKWKKKLISRIQ